MKDVAIPDGRTCAVCEASLDEVGYACLQPTCVDLPDGVRSYVQRGTWFCGKHYAWHLRNAHGVAEQELQEYLDPKEL